MNSSFEINLHYPNSLTSSKGSIIHVWILLVICFPFVFHARVFDPRRNPDGEAYRYDMEEPPAIGNAAATFPAIKLRKILRRQ